MGPQDVVRTSVAIQNLPMFLQPCHTTKPIRLVVFFPVCMVVPDLMQICMIMLFSEGFESATVLGKKMTTLYGLAKEQLSKQYHYDWGLRALKSASDLKILINAVADDSSQLVHSDRKILTHVEKDQDRLYQQVVLQNRLLTGVP